MVPSDREQGYLKVFKEKLKNQLQIFKENFDFIFKPPGFLEKHFLEIFFREHMFVKNMTSQVQLKIISQLKT